jgi:hypothetical protein
MPEFKITIDTNVFVHLFNNQDNEDEHIDRLLGWLVDRLSILCVDDKKRMEGEYITHVIPLIKKASDQTLKVYWLRYFMEFGERHLVPLAFGDDLLVSIRGQIRFAEPSDHVFVYVAAKSNTLLVSNNPKHITNHSNGLRKCAKRYGSKMADFVTSIEAVAAFNC